MPDLLVADARGADALKDRVEEVSKIDRQERAERCRRARRSSACRGRWSCPASSSATPREGREGAGRPVEGAHAATGDRRRRRGRLHRQRAEDATHWPRQLFVRFGPDDRVAEVRVRYAETA